jgi:hypothetical protein
MRAVLFRVKVCRGACSAGFESMRAVQLRFRVC